MTIRRVVTDEQVGQFARKVRDLQERVEKGVVPFKPTMDGLQLFVEGRPVEAIQGDNPLAPWQAFYREYFDLEKDFSGLVIPKKKGFDRLLVIAQGMTPNKLFEKCRELFPCWRYRDDLDVITSDRKPDHDYVVLVRDRVEADEELKNRSADDLKAKGIPGITLGERLIYELKFFQETGQHLDRGDITLCTGSRDPDGDVPYVDWFADMLKVYWCHPDCRRDFLRSRVVVC